MSQALTHWLEAVGIVNQNKVFHNPGKAFLVTESVLKNEGQLTQDGALGVMTTPYTGRSPEDKYIVDDQNRTDIWLGDVNKSLTPELFTHLQNKITTYLNNRTLYVIDCFIGADKVYRQSIRVVAECAWQALVAQNLFIYDGSKHASPPDITIYAAPSLNTQPEIDFVRDKAAIAIDLNKKTVLIAGSKYAGEIKKSAFTIMNALSPESNVFPMHCSANVGEKGDVAIYFGLSGTGKTTLSSTSDRLLIGDDEHGWGENGVFNFEGGSYAKTIRLNKDLEPVIWQAANQFGTVLENVYIRPENQKADFDDSRFTENTRAAYPLAYVENIVPGGMANHPENIFFLTADAFGVMPPIAKLNPNQAIYYFLSGYTSKVAGTERGLGQQPIATFSACFAEPFLPLMPDVYANLLQQKLDTHHCNVWLLNTGWTGGDYHTGYRMPLPHTRRMVNWILTGEHQNAKFHSDSIFDIAVPDKIQGLPDNLLHPEMTWEDKNSFMKVANELKNDFDQNFEKYETYLV